MIFTSKASGNWSATGQTTWNEVGYPAVGDTVVINGAHVVTVDLSEDIGDGSSTALSIAANGTLTLADGVTLGVYGGIDNAGSINLGVGSAVNSHEPEIVGSITVVGNVASATHYQASISLITGNILLSLVPVAAFEHTSTLWTHLFHHRDLTNLFHHRDLTNVIAGRQYANTFSHRGDFPG